MSPTLAGGFLTINATWQVPNAQECVGKNNYSEVLVISLSPSLHGIFSVKRNGDIYFSLY